MRVVTYLKSRKLRGYKMVFPNKYLKFKNSLLNLGSIIIKNMKKNFWYTVDEIWRDLKVEESVRQYTFNDLILTFDFLFSINSISINSEGKVCLN